MEKSKAAFRALREECGLTQQDIADEAGVKILSVKTWENPETYPKEPPEDVWQFLLQTRMAMYADADELARQMTESLNDVDGSQAIILDYFRKQEELDAVQCGTGIDEPVGYFNARMRAVARLLEEQGIPCSFRYPD